LTSIVLAADDRYLPFVPCTLRQVSIHGRSASSVVLAVPSGTSGSAVAPAVAAATRFGVSLDIVELSSLADLERRGAIADRGHVSAFTYSKLVLAEDLVDHDDVLYLDIDTLVRGSLDPLLDWPLRFEVGGVPELGTNGVHLFQTVRTPYFNAGVLRMGLGRMRESGLWSRAQRILRRRSRLPFQDQDILNIVYRDAFDILPPTYNVFDLAVREAPPYFQVFHDPTIVHFVGPTKPWHRESGTPNAREWRRMNAETMALSAEKTQFYVNGSRRDSRHRVSATIAAARFSPLGRQVRAVLPYEVKHAVNQTVLKIVAPRTQLADEVLAGIVANRTSREAAPTTTVAATMLPRPSEPAPVVAQRTTAAGPAAARRSSSDLVLVVSAPRSGTNAFGSLIRSGYPQATWAGEAYGGAPEGSIHEQLKAEFSWYARPATSAFARGINQDAAALTRRIMELADGPTAIKLFGPQLSPAAFDAVLEEFSPRLIVLRRVNLFSCVSMRRSANTGVWFREELTDVSVQLQDQAVAAYTKNLDRWFDRVEDRIESYGLDALWMTYSQVYETRSALTAIREFLPDWTLGPLAVDDDSWLPRTTIQDRRTDESIEQTMHALVGLTPANQEALLRLPGRRPAPAQ
jgi:lipopolysaccharide biosynthesis glycosyltransferase